MDSKLINIVCGHALYKYEWPKLSQAKDGSEWVFIDSGDKLRTTLVLEIIADLLEEPTVYFLKGRHNSKEISTNDLLQVILDNNCSFALMKMDYSKAVEFRGDICRVGFLL